MIRSRILVLLFFAAVSLVSRADAQIHYVGDDVPPPDMSQGSDQSSLEDGYQKRYAEQGSAPRYTMNRSSRSVESNPEANKAIANSGSLVKGASNNSTEADGSANTPDESDAPSGGNKMLGIGLLIVGTVMAGYWIFLARRS